MSVRKEDPAFEIEFFERILRKDPLQVDVLRQIGHLYTRNGRLAEGLKVDRALAVLCPADPIAQYNLACSYSLLGRIDEAFASLQEAIQCGYRDLDHLRNDPDLAPIRRDPRFEKVFGSARRPGTSARGA